MARAFLTTIPLLASLSILLAAATIHAAPGYPPKQAVTTRDAVVQAQNIVPVRGGGIRGGGYQGGGYRSGSTGRFYNRLSQPRRPSSGRSPTIRSPGGRSAPKVGSRIVPRSTPNTAPRMSRTLPRPSPSRNLGGPSSRFSASRIQPRSGMSQLRPLKHALPRLRKSGVSDRIVQTQSLAGQPSVGTRFRSGAFRSKLGQRNQNVHKKTADLTAKPANQNHAQAGIRIARANQAKPTSSAKFHLFAVSKRAVAGQFTGHTNRGLYGAAGTQAVLKLRTDPRVALAHRKLNEKIQSLQPRNVYPPNNGFLGKKRLEILKPGTMIDRYGDSNGRFASPPGTPIEARALSPTERSMPPTKYVVLKPVKAWTGQARPWFNQSGLGTQYQFRVRLEKLIKEEFIRELP